MQGRGFKMILLPTLRIPLLQIRLAIPYYLFPISPYYGTYTLRNDDHFNMNVREYFKVLLKRVLEQITVGRDIKVTIIAIDESKLRIHLKFVSNLL